MTETHTYKNYDTEDIFTKIGTGTLSISDFCTEHPNSFNGKSVVATKIESDIRRYNVWKLKNLKNNEQKRNENKDTTELLSLFYKQKG